MQPKIAKGTIRGRCLCTSDEERCFSMETLTEPYTIDHIDQQPRGTKDFEKEVRAPVDKDDRKFPGNITAERHQRYGAHPVPEYLPDGDDVVD